jgi:hypothetical protein
MPLLVVMVENGLGAIRGIRAVVLTTKRVLVLQRLWEVAPLA